MMRKRKRCSTPPGRIILEDYLKPLGLTMARLAEMMGVSRKTLSKIINERGSVTPEMALCLSRAFDTSPGFRLNLQKNYDLWQAEHTSNAWKLVNPVFYQPRHSET